MSRFMQQLSLVLVPIALALAWAGGDMRQHQGVALQLANISPEIEGLTRIDERVFQGYLKGNPKDYLYIAHEDHVSYGGPLRTAVVVDKDNHPICGSSGQRRHPVLSGKGGG